MQNGQPFVCVCVRACACALACTCACACVRLTDRQKKKKNSKNKFSLNFFLIWIVFCVVDVVVAVIAIVDDVPSVGGWIPRRWRKNDKVVFGWVEKKRPQKKAGKKVTVRPTDGGNPNPGYTAKISRNSQI